MTALPVPFGFLGLGYGLGPFDPFGKFKEVGQDQPGNFGNFLRFILPDWLDRVHILIRDAANAVGPFFQVGRKQSRFCQHVYAGAEVSWGGFTVKTAGILGQDFFGCYIQNRAESGSCDAGRNIACNQCLFGFKHTLTHSRGQQFRCHRPSGRGGSAVYVPGISPEIYDTPVTYINGCSEAKNDHLAAFRVSARSDRFTPPSWLGPAPHKRRLFHRILVKQFTDIHLPEGYVLSIAAWAMILEFWSVLQSHV
nr:hypothetical protein [Komagataeibacter oboediens]